MLADLIIKSHCIVTCRDDIPFETIDGYIAVINDCIAAIEAGAAPHEISGPSTRVIDARDQTVIPGLIDPHTHLIHGGSRENELALKLKGVPYLEILNQGGGILSTVNNTRQASDKELEGKARRSLDQMLLHGTTTVEAKSGYGLDLKTEARCLQIARRLNQDHPIDIVSTYMGAHAIPPEYRGNIDGYIAYMIDQVMPYVATERLAEFMDVFCEEGVFSPTQSKLLMEAGTRLGFKLKIHADEIIPLQGAELAAELHAVSADHLLAASEAGMEAMKQAGVTAVLLPGTSFYLMLGRYADARQMLGKGIRVALATDYNPGTCPTENLQAIMTFACFGMHMTPEEIIQAMTINAAYAVDRADTIGSIEVGKKADLVILNAPDLDYVIYHFGINHVDKVIKGGKVIVDQGQIVNLT